MESLQQNLHSLRSLNLPINKFLHTVKYGKKFKNIKVNYDLKNNKLRLLFKNITPLISSVITDSFGNILSILYNVSVTNMPHSTDKILHPLLDGTMINLYQWDDKWAMHTLGGIDISNVEIFNHKIGEVFKSLILEKYEGVDLDKSLTYNIILSHSKLHPFVTSNKITYIKTIDKDLNITRVNPGFCSYTTLPNPISTLDVEVESKVESELDKSVDSLSEEFEKIEITKQSNSDVVETDSKESCESPLKELKEKKVKVKTPTKLPEATDASETVEAAKVPDNNLNDTLNIISTEEGLGTVYISDDDTKTSVYMTDRFKKIKLFLYNFHYPKFVRQNKCINRLLFITLYWYFNDTTGLFKEMSLESDILTEYIKGIDVVRDEVQKSVSEVYYNGKTSTTTKFVKRIVSKINKQCMDVTPVEKDVLFKNIDLALMDYNSLYELYKLYEEICPKIIDPKM